MGTVKPERGQGRASTDDGADSPELSTREVIVRVLCD